MCWPGSEPGRRECLRSPCPSGSRSTRSMRSATAIDVYRGTAPPVRSFIDFACYIALFPQLVAGPIIRYNTVADQLVDRSHTWEKFGSGVTLFILGFAKKILLANPMGRVADAAL